VGLQLLVAEKEGALADRGDPRRPIWAKWRVDDDGTVSVVATYAEGKGYAQRERSFNSLDEAAAELGDSLRDVVERALEANSQSGRWRP
jgi:hypothetical protein